MSKVIECKSQHPKISLFLYTSNEKPVNEIKKTVIDINNYDHKLHKNGLCPLFKEAKKKKGWNKSVGSMAKNWTQTKYPSVGNQ